MNKYYFIICCFLMCFQFMNAQILKKETLTNQGSSHFVNANNKSYFIQESIGQASVIRTFNTSNYSLRQGFLQPISASQLNGGTTTNLDAVVYPNPFINQINISFNEPIIDVLKVFIYDVLGRIVYQNVYNASQTIQLTVNNISTGNYFLKVNMRSKLLYAKLIKR